MNDPSIVYKMNPRMSNGGCIGGSRAGITAILLTLMLPRHEALKLQPVVQYLSEKLDISVEAKKINSAFEDAKNLLVDRSNRGVVLDEIPPSNLLLDPVIRRLRSAIDRWNSVEEKLRNSVSKADANHHKLAITFDDALNKIVASRVLVGHLYWRTLDFSPALKELEPTCPTLWDYDTAKESLDNEGWLDCFTTLGDIYLQLNRIDQAVELEKNMVRRLPWLALAFSGKSTLSKLRTLSTLKHLVALPRMERGVISLHTKAGWAAADRMRSRMNELVKSFVAAESQTRRIGILARARNVIEEVTLLYRQELYTAMHSSSSISQEGDENIISDPLQGNSEVVTTARPKMNDNGSASTAIADLLLESLIVELEREGGFYVSTMNGLIEGGKHFIDAIRLREQEKTKERDEAAAMAAIANAAQLAAASLRTSDNKNVPSTPFPPPASLAITAAPMGFQSRDQVMRIFEYYEEAHLDRQHQADAARTARKAARYATKSPISSPSTGSSSSSVKGNWGPGTSTSTHKQSHSSREKDGGMGGIDGSGPGSTPSPPKRQWWWSALWGFVGVSAFTAMYVRSGGVMGTNKNHPNTLNDTISPRNAKSHKNNKHQSNSKMGGESNNNYLFAFLVFVVGPTMTAKLPEGVERTCGLISSLLVHVMVWLMTWKNNLLTAVGVSDNGKIHSIHSPSSSKMTESFGRKTMHGKQKTATKKSSKSYRSDLKVDVAVANGVETREGSDDEDDQDLHQKQSTEEEDTASTEDDRHPTMDEDDIFRATIGDAAYRAASAEMDEADLKVFEAIYLEELAEFHRSEGGWIETSAQQTRGKAKKTLTNSPGNRHHSQDRQGPSGSAVEAVHAKARQRLLQEQLQRKAVGIAFCSTSGNPSNGVKSALKSPLSSSSSSTSRGNGQGTGSNSNQFNHKSSSIVSTSQPSVTGNGFKDHHATSSLSPTESPCNTIHRPVLGGVTGAWAGIVAGATGGGANGSNPQLGSPSPTSVSNIDGSLGSPSHSHRNHVATKGSTHGMSQHTSQGVSKGASTGPANDISMGTTVASTNRSATSFLKNLLFSRSTPAPVITTTPTAIVTTPTSGRNKKRKEHLSGIGASTTTGINRHGDHERNIGTYPTEFPDLPGRNSGAEGVSTNNHAIDHHPPGPPIPVMTNGRLLYSQSESSSQMTHHSTVTDMEDQSSLSGESDEHRPMTTLRRKKGERKSSNDEEGGEDGHDDETNHMNESLNPSQPMYGTEPLPSHHQQGHLHPSQQVLMVTPEQAVAMMSGGYHHPMNMIPGNGMMPMPMTLPNGMPMMGMPGQMGYPMMGYPMMPPPFVQGGMGVGGPSIIPPNNHHNNNSNDNQHNDNYGNVPVEMMMMGGLGSGSGDSYDGPPLPVVYPPENVQYFVSLPPMSHHHMAAVDAMGNPMDPMNMMQNNGEMDYTMQGHPHAQMQMSGNGGGYYDPQHMQQQPQGPTHMQQQHQSQQQQHRDGKRSRGGYDHRRNGDNNNDVNNHGNKQQQQQQQQQSARNNTLDALRQQIEYYFSDDNLCRDVYLRRKMDHEGFVRLEEIASFNRIVQLGATPATMLEAVRTSSSLEVVNEGSTQGKSFNIVFAGTKIRSAMTPLKWVGEVA